MNTFARENMGNDDDHDQNGYETGSVIITKKFLMDMKTGYYTKQM